MELTPEAVEIYSQEEVAKFLATSDTDGKVNVVLIISQLPGDPGQLVFGQFLMQKTRDNLGTNSRVASMAVTKDLKSVEIVADFEGFTDTGPNVDMINSMSLFRYNPYLCIREVGSLSIKNVYPLKKLSYPAVLKDFLALKIAKPGIKTNGSRDGVQMPRAVSSKFKNIMSICAIAYLAEDGYPRIVPALSTTVLDGGYVVVKLASNNRELAEVDLPLQVAINVITMHPTSYQVKGSLERRESRLGSRLGLVRVEEVYSAMPPLSGERII